MANELRTGKLFPIGFHIGIGGNASGLVSDFLRPLDTNGIRFMLMSTDVYPLDAVNLAKQSGIQHTIIWRPTGIDTPLNGYTGDPSNAADEHYSATMNIVPDEFDKELVHLGFLNEIDKNQSIWLSAFAKRWSENAIADGYMPASFGWSSGEPEYEHWLQMGDYLRFVSENRDKCLIMLHEYSFDVNDIFRWHPYLVGRYKFLLDACDELGIPHVPFAITEWGWTHENTPEAQLALTDISDVAREYVNVQECYGAALWYLGGGFGGIADKAQKIIKPLGEMAVSEWDYYVDWKDEPEPVPDTVEEFIWNESQGTRVMTTNVDAALQKKLYDNHYVPVGSEKWVNYKGTTYAIQLGDSLIGSPSAVAVAEVPKWDNVWLQLEPAEEPDTTEFRLQSWPTEYKVITQWFGVNKQNYERFNLPGHDGVDIRAPLGSAIFAAADGVVSYVGNKVPGTNMVSEYGYHVRLSHRDDFTTIYAHLAGDMILYSLSIGDSVVAGQRIGSSGNTGNSFGAHLHFCMRKPPGDYGWPYNIINPEPYLLDFDGVIDGTGTAPQVDLADFFFPPSGNEFGQIYILKNNWGAGDERVQLQRSGLWSYVTKNNLWEKRYIGDDFIDLRVDTSPSDTEYYTVDGHWLPRRMRIGDSFYREEHVVFYDKSTCAEKANYSWGSTIKFVALHGSWVNNGIELNDVAEFNWIVGGEVEEKYFYAKNLGLVKWQNKRGLESSIWELVPEGAQQNNQRGTWCGIS